MAAKNKKNFVLEDLEVIDISTEGKAIAKHDGLVVFIEGGIPGDRVDVLVHKKKSSFAEGRVQQIREQSAYRVQPVCEHFGTCGGCKWQNLSYDQQMHFKQKYVNDAFQRIAKVQFPEPLPILGNKDPYFYRNKLEFSFSNKRWLSTSELVSDKTIDDRDGLGFHIPGMFDKVLDIRNCYLQKEPSNSIRLFVKQYAQQHKLSFFDIRNKSGFLRTLMIRSSAQGQVMVVLSVFEWLEKELFALLDALSTKFPAITSLQYVHNAKANDTFDGLDIKTYSGKDHIVEIMEGLSFKISAKSFYQTNSDQAYGLYRVAREFADLKKEDTVYDLYTGTGTIANFVARHCQKVIGIEYVEQAVADARENSAFNHIGNTEFFAGDMKDILNADFITRSGRPSVVITDPPRAGMHEDVVNAILAAEPEKVVYVSCNPSTQARDIALMDSKYRITRLQAVDMFPQTAHVENVALLEIR